MSEEDYKKLTDKIIEKKKEAVGLPPKRCPKDGHLLNGTVLYFEPTSNQYIMCNPEDIANAINKLNNMLTYETGEADVNDFLYLIGGVERPLMYDYGWDKLHDKELEYTIDEGPLKDNVYPSATINIYPSPRHFSVY